MSKLIHDGRHLLYSTEVAAKIGRNEAICLQQIYYWMNVNGGKIVDGIKWFWKTYQQWSEELQLSISTVRRVIKKLKQLGLIAVDRLSAKTYYQANWYTLQIEAVQALFQNEQIDAIALNNSMCSKSTNHIKEFPSEENSPQRTLASTGGTPQSLREELISPQLLSARQCPQQHCADVEKEEVGGKGKTQQTEDLEQSQITRYVQDIEQDNSISFKDSHEGQFSGDEIEEVESDTTLDKPEKSEIREVCTELKRLQINPDPCLGVIKKYWENVPGAIARVKEAVNEGWCNNPTGLFINSCKSGEKPKNVLDVEVKTWFEWARKERIVLAMSGGLAYTPNGKAIKISEMMQKHPIPGI